MKTFSIVILFLVGIGGAQIFSQNTTVTQYEIPCYSEIDSSTGEPVIYPILNDELEQYRETVEALFDTLYYKHDGIVPGNHYIIVVEMTIKSLRTKDVVTLSIKRVIRKTYPIINGNEYQFPCYALLVGDTSVCVNCILEGYEVIPTVDSIMRSQFEGKEIIPSSCYMVTLQEVSTTGASRGREFVLKGVLRDDAPKVIAKR